MTIEEKMRLVIKLAEDGMKQGEIPIAAIIEIFIIVIPF